MEGISNKTIVSLFAEKTNDDIKKVLLVFFLLNKNFIAWFNIMIESKSNYPFIIINSDWSDKKCMNWCRFLDLHTKTEVLLFDSFGFEGFK